MKKLEVNYLNVYLILMAVLATGAILVLALLIFTGGQIKQSLQFAILLLVPFTVFYISSCPIVTRKVVVRDGYLQLGLETIAFRHIRKAYAIGPLQKFLLSLVQKKQIYAYKRYNKSDPKMRETPGKK